MKKYILLLLLLIGATVCRGQSNNNDSVASRIIADTKYYIDSNGYKILDDSIVYTYTGSYGGDLTHHLKPSTIVGYIFNNFYKKLNKTSAVQNAYTQAQYDSNQHYIRFDTSGLKGNFCYNSLNLFDSNDNLKELLIQKCIYTGKFDWKNDARVSYKYNINNNEVADTSQNWDGVWQDHTLMKYEYDSHNNKIFEMCASWVISNWKFDCYCARYNYTYDDSGKILSDLILEYPGDTIQFDTANLVTYTYYKNTKNDSQEIWHRYSNHKWDTTIMYVYTYNKNNNELSETISEWYHKKWGIAVVTTYTYNKYNQVVLEVTKAIDKKFSIYSQSGEEHYYYEIYHLKKKKNK